MAYIMEKKAEILKYQGFLTVILSYLRCYNKGTVIFLHHCRPNKSKM